MGKRMENADFVTIEVSNGPQASQYQGQGYGGGGSGYGSYGEGLPGLILLEVS